jgi:hypothetical protein
MVKTAKVAFFMVFKISRGTYFYNTVASLICKDEKLWQNKNDTT